ncbi:MAG: type II toxin-antitoxin system PemK/MazF family toxin [Candidatus Omnitrophica bacterium]|nr:type II toxin-antitoxin system PemK/MazF family toxin [Candidatus Omnitrophota bacterium]
MTSGDVVLVLFPFTDLTSAKVRPALVISSAQQLAQGPDAIFMAITTVASNQKPTDFFLEETHPEFAATGLKRSSVFRTDKIFCGEKKLAKHTLGTIGPAIRKEISNRIRAVLEFK